MDFWILTSSSEETDTAGTSIPIDFKKKNSVILSSPLLKHSNPSPFSTFIIEFPCSYARIIHLKFIWHTLFYSETGNFVAGVEPFIFFNAIFRHRLILLLHRHKRHRRGDAHKIGLQLGEDHPLVGHLVGDGGRHQAGGSVHVDIGLAGEREVDAGEAHHALQPGEEHGLAGHGGHSQTGELLLQLLGFFWSRRLPLFDQGQHIAHAQDPGGPCGRDGKARSGPAFRRYR